MRKVIAISFLFMFWLNNSFAQDETTDENQKIKFYAGYDLGEMAFNRFQNFAGELGLGLKNDHVLSFVYLNVKLTESHLTSGFARAVDGGNVTGHWTGYELSYNVPVVKLKKEGHLLYVGGSGGYHKNIYSHVVLSESVEHKTFTAGLNLGYREDNLFKVKGLYYNLQIPIRYYFTKLDETRLGESTVNEVIFEQTISFFVGYQF